MSWPILSIVTFLPLVGVAFILMINDEEQAAARNARWVALFTSVTTFILSLFVLGRFDASLSGFQMVEQVEWLTELGISYKMGVDGISVWFVLLSTLLVPICIAASWESITKRVREYMIAFLVLETMMVGMFCALDLILFYILFEGVLIPMFLIIGIWGGARRV
jgi:NADH-quinone oxidoreductase subunit M